MTWESLVPALSCLVEIIVKRQTDAAFRMSLDKLIEREAVEDLPGEASAAAKRSA